MEDRGASSSCMPQEETANNPEQLDGASGLKLHRFSAPPDPNAMQSLIQQEFKEDKQIRRASEPPPMKQTKPIALAVARGNYLQGAGELIPGMVARLAGNAVGLTGFGLGYAMGKLGHQIIGSAVADSGCLLAGCRGMLTVNGIFPTVICEYGDMELGPLPEEGSVRQDLLRDTPLIVSNHVSHLDAAAILPCVLELPKFVSMSEVKSYPIFGSLGEDLEYIWVDRKSKDSRAKTLEAITMHTESWQQGDRPLVVFPEGTTSNGSSLLEFRKGAFVSGRPVRPLLLKYTGSWDPASVDLREQPRVEPGAKRNCAPGCGGRRKPKVAAESSGDQRYEQYTDADWAAQFAGHLAHTCVVFICRPYYPDEAEQADPELYATNVRSLMLARLAELHAALDDADDPWADPSERLRCWRRTMQLKSQISSGMRPSLRGGAAYGSEGPLHSAASSSFPPPTALEEEDETADRSAVANSGGDSPKVRRNERRKSLQESLRGSWCESSTPQTAEDMEQRASRVSIARAFLDGGMQPRLAA